MSTLSASLLRPDIARRSGDARVKTGAKVALLIVGWLIMVGLTPFSAYGNTGDDDATSGLRTILFLMCFAGVFVGLFRGGPLSVLKTLPLSLVALMAWCCITLLWSIDQQVATYRTVLSLSVTLTIFGACRVLKAEEILETLTVFLIGILVIDVLSSLVVPNARHLAGDRARALVGMWRGLHSHKNIAGSVAALGLLVSIFYIDKRQWRFWILAGASMLMLLQSGSKTSLSMVVMTVLIVLVLRAARSRRIDVKLLLLFQVILGLSALSIYIYQNFDVIGAFLDDGDNLTGRVALWKILITYWQSEPWGSGFESFWRIGVQSPAYEYIISATDFAASAPHGHNGYLDMLASTGLPGTILSVNAMLIVPVYLYVFKTSGRDRFATVAVSLLVFASLHNLLESSIFKGARVGWFAVCIGLAILSQASAIRGSVRSR